MECDGREYWDLQAGIMRTIWRHMYTGITFSIISEDVSVVPAVGDLAAQKITNDVPDRNKKKYTTGGALVSHTPLPPRASII